MNSKVSIVLAATTIGVLTGCSSKLAQPKAEYFTLNPSPLEAIGGQVSGVVVGKIPANYFVRNAQLTVTPVLSYNGQEIKAASSTFQGEKVRGNNPVVNYEYGGTINVPVDFAYAPAMEQADVILQFQGQNGNKVYPLNPITIGHGINTTAMLATANGINPSIAPDKFQKNITEKYDADIMFLINQANIRDNQLRSDDMKAFNANVKAAANDTTRRIEEINIQSYASPEGGVELNERLAANREENTSKYLKEQLKSDNISNFGELTANFTAQDWEGFQRLVSESNIQDKDLVLSVLSMYKDPEQREREIRNLSSVFDQLADEILPKLRYSRLTATVSVIGKSDAEIADLYAKDPSKLSADEILYYATLTDDNAKRRDIYNTASRLYPTDYRAFNNLGAMQLENGDIRAARANFAEAERLNGSNPEAKANEAIVSMINGNLDNANTLLGAAAGAEQLPDALGTYNLLRGNVTAATKAFGNTKSNNAAVAQILSKDYTKAKQTLSGITTPDATTYYLMAIVGARTNNDSMVKTNLRQAIRLDSKMADRARTDLEFAGFNLSSIL